MFPGLNLYHPCADPAQHLVTADAGSNVDYPDDLFDLYDLDHDPFEVQSTPL